jgi:hypothetical protein
MDRDGVFVCHDFLPPQAFREVRDEIARSLTAPLRSRYKRTDYGDNFLDEQLTLTDWPNDFPGACRHLRDNLFLLQLASAVSRRGMSFKPHLVTQYLHKPDSGAPFVDYDDAQCLHTDRHFAFIKAFLYLDDVDQGGAPYTYVPGSHRVTLARLEYEYELSLRIVQARERERRATTMREKLAVAREIYASCDKLVAKMGLSERPIFGKANTLIVSNNKGLHRRGPMPTAPSRLMMIIDFKYLESLAHDLYPVLRHLAEMPPRV